jgi:hypothetical protein
MKPKFSIDLVVRGLCTATAVLALSVLFASRGEAALGQTVPSYCQQWQQNFGCFALVNGNAVMFTPNRCTDSGQCTTCTDTVIGVCYGGCGGEDCEAPGWENYGV